MGGNMEMSSGATNIDVHPSGSKDTITVVGTLKLNGVLALTVSPCGSTDSGKDHVVISATAIEGTFGSITGAGEEVEVVYGPETVTVKTCYTTKAPTKAPSKAPTKAPTKAQTMAPSKKPTNKLRISAGVSVGSGVSKLVLVTIACMLSVSWLTAM